MRLRSLKTFGSFAVAAAMALILAGCRGAAGQDGLDGNDGTDGQPGSPGNVVINAKALTREQWAALRLKGEVTSVTAAGTRPVVTFKLTDANGTPVAGMNWESKAANAAYTNYPNLAFGLAKLIPATFTTGSTTAMIAPSRWVNYIVTNPTGTNPNSLTWTPTRPTTDNIGELVDNRDGTYQYTFRRDISQAQSQLNLYNYTGVNLRADLDDVTYQPTLTHRITIQIGGAYRGTGNASTRDANTADGNDSGLPAINVAQPANIIYDFVPSANRPVNASDTQRELVSTAACNECHSTLGHGFHNGLRTDARYCAMCHTDQRKYGYADSTNNKQKNHAVGDFVMLGHTLHMGGRTINRNGLSPRTTHDYNYAGVQYKETGYPMDIRACVKCHHGDAALQRADYVTKPSRLACGGCHDGINWSAGHYGGVRTDDSSCYGCHSNNQTQTRHVTVAHRGVDVTKNNPVTKSAYRNFTYELRSATMNSDRTISVVFRIKMDGETLATRTSLSPTGFTNGPRFHIAYAMPQDGIERPADFNVYGNGHYATLANILNGSYGSLPAAPDNDGWWTATITTALSGGNVNVPANASMVTCWLDGSWYQSDITEPNLAPTASYTRYRVAASPKVLVGGITGNAQRREVVSTAKCNDCHEMLGTSHITRYYPAHSGGAANDAILCGVCHYVNRSGNGWSGNIQYITHAVHGLGKRNVPYARYINVTNRPPNTAGGEGIGGYGYPGVLNDCEQCHLPGTYDFSSVASQNALPNMLWSTVAAGAITVGGQTAPYVSSGNYGTAVSYPNTTQATTTTLVNSPITHACFGCHDSNMAIEHMKLNGGAFFASRGSLNGNVQGAKLTNRETCLLCHGSGKIADIKSSHAKH
jgi:OmcA/MtrC family decaheme c-type cytochrome